MSSPLARDRTGNRPTDGDRVVLTPDRALSAIGLLPRVAVWWCCAGLPRGQIVGRSIPEPPRLRLDDRLGRPTCSPSGVRRSPTQPRSGTPALPRRGLRVTTELVRGADRSATAPIIGGRYRPDVRGAA